MSIKLEDISTESLAERIKVWRTEAAMGWMDYDCPDLFDAVCAQRDAAIAKIARMREALEPLLLRLNEHDEMLSGDPDTTKIFVPLGDLRRARAALAD